MPVPHSLLISHLIELWIDCKDPGLSTRRHWEVEAAYNILPPIQYSKICYFCFPLSASNKSRGLWGVTRRLSGTGGSISGMGWNALSVGSGQPTFTLLYVHAFVFKYCTFQCRSIWGFHGCHDNHRSALAEFCLNAFGGHILDLVFTAGWAAVDLDEEGWHSFLTDW